ncbi:MAG TPA: MarR family transcriptional regulator [Clostridium sp.]|nr:MarR family transcriptional regulator [Clostridium sp. Bc-iso-3]HHV30393.1 MarR family transcriptional regulator [Clostridium sp.]
MSDIDNSKQLREVIRILERKLGVLGEFKTSCCGVTMAQCHALVEIGRAGDISLKELSEILNLDSSSMSRTVNNLVNNGLVRRDIDPLDRRYVTITLTESGNELFRSIEERMNSYFESVYLALPEDKRKQVLESLDILIGAIDKKNVVN